MLTTMTFAPVAGALLILLLPKKANNAVKWVSLLAAAVPLALCWPLVEGFDPAKGKIEAFSFVQQIDWIRDFNIQYYVGVDGLSVTMVVLTALLSFLCVIASWGFEHWHTNRGIKGYFALFLLLETGMMGVFVSLDFFLFYVFWEVMLLPMYFLIGIWGGPRREYAAIKFFLYTLAGSVLMLIVMLAFAFTVDGNPAKDGHQLCFNMVTLMQRTNLFQGMWWFLAFVGLYIGFAIKIPAFPFHTWLPDAHVEAPTPISVILAGVLLKMGTYGLMRINYSILPEQARDFAPMMMLLGFVGIVYGALCAMAQIKGVPRVNSQTGEHFIERDWKKLIAYSSVSHMGFCMIGMAGGTSAGMAGAMFQMWNHGCITGMLFLLVGVLYDRAHHRNIDGFGGLWTPMPTYGGITALAFMASLGLPGLAGFVSEALCFIGAFQASDARPEVLWGYGDVYYRVLTALSVTGVVFGAGYFLWSYQKVFLGPLNPKYEGIKDVSWREQVTLWPLAAIIVVLGVAPGLYLRFVTPALDFLVQHQLRMPWVVKP
ncbi:MAG: NADH-quinone oxidoreductase subunit M [Planctomycetes bacterium]|nr:NADH-quinone oxidoreductase subunit M [Planctomycetota bacterium]